MKWYLEALKKYATFSGRARRKEFWMFVLFNYIFMIALMILTLTIKQSEGIVGILFTLYSLAVIIPMLAVAVRRLHDVDISGWYLLIGLVPIIGSIILLVKYCSEGTPGTNRYGINPKETA